MTPEAEPRFPQSFTSLSPSFREEWRPVIGYAGLYMVSSLGRVYSVRTGRILLGTVTKQGYVQVRLTDRHMNARCRTVHVLAAEAFIGPRPTGHVVNHRNAKKTFNVVSNLEYVTPGENIRRAVRLGHLRPHFKPGENNINARLTADDVRAIRALREQRVPAAELAAQYGVTTATIYRIGKRVLWRYIA